MIRKTSLDAYKEITSNGLLSKRRLEVYQILYKYGPLTGSQVSSKWKAVYGERNSENVRNRITELVKSGVSYIVKNVKDKTTGMSVSLFDVNSNLPTKIKKKESKDSIIARYEKTLKEIVEYSDCGMSRSEAEKALGTYDE